MKYIIKLTFEVDGSVDKPDVIGAIFGQTENLFGQEFDLRELQDKGRLGRIIVEIKNKGGKAEGYIEIPSNLDRVETALIASMVESVEKVGPYNAKFELKEIEDVRAEKLKKIIERAKQILTTWTREKNLDIKEVMNEISGAVKTGELIEYGPERLPAGPDVYTDPNLIIVEGRADIINLLRYGYKNTVAVEGASGKIPQSVVELSKNKKMVIAFLDGDHGGDMILKDLINANVKIDYVARAPVGREVEELTGKEIAKSLSNMIPLSQYLKRQQESIASVSSRIETASARAEVAEQQTVQVVEQPRKEIEIKIPGNVMEEIKKLPGTLEGIIFDENWNLVERVQVRDIITKLENLTNGNASFIIFDGVITQRLLELAASKNVKLIIGVRIGGINKKPENVKILTLADVIGP
ncbi:MULTISPECIES: DNA primase DnaG [Metallosphaera]|uniref:DNA primase DnaG n=2 Tax=Metallosphaera TaxID=41980 RepID=A0A0K1TBW5_9CREN|nr:MULTISPECIES: DNA primase DnaG [Metallosphaera]AKV75418.1 DNA primase [Metallosphaera sedula]AKV77661.1 DNA primase [Metallosphaera sedula]AKV79908.1 DNA primase [Metallosphaera sedula]AKV82153.1 DNA primase [Metallosphaera sedula]AKV84402.1 DNA primase [Metallosphaera sedula]